MCDVFKVREVSSLVSTLWLMFHDISGHSTLYITALVDDSEELVVDMDNATHSLA
jgi:hypothetical protein